MTDIEHEFEIGRSADLAVLEHAGFDVVFNHEAQE